MTVARRGTFDAASPLRCRVRLALVVAVALSGALAIASAPAAARVSDPEDSAPATAAVEMIFADGFESGDSDDWEPPAGPDPSACADNDGDGFVVCDGCTVPAGKSCGDCDDDDPAKNSGERCDEIDNDCDGSVDEGFFVGEACGICNGPGCTAAGLDNTTASDPFSSGFCLVEVNCPDEGAFDLCLSGSVVECSADGLSSVCPVPAADPDAATEDEGITLFAEEGGGLTDAERRDDLTCSDSVDNDCDGTADLGGVVDSVDGTDIVLAGDEGCFTAEFCDGRDNDGDSAIDEDFPIGQICSAGIGACQAAGELLCNADGSGTQCSAVPGVPGIEGPPASFLCSDGVDNDCDGGIDLPAFLGDPAGDADCIPEEICDGVDNDLDGSIDENVDDLGASCTVFAGTSSALECRADGVNVCSPNGSGTVCDASAPPIAVEGPSNPGSCADLLDNDCDGSVDGEDASCGASGLTVTCSLPFHQPPGGKGNDGRGEPGSDCNSWHRLRWDVFGDPDGLASVRAELLGIGRDGKMLAAIPVEQGDIAHLKSRIDLDDFKAKTKTTAGKVTHDLSMPIPLLKVTADDGLRRTSAFCSLIPYLEVIEPAGQVVSLDQGDTTDVLVALPFVDVLDPSFSVKIDGLDLFAELGVEPADCNPSTPCNGVLPFPSGPVQVTDLAVDVAASFETFAANTLRMTLSGLGCGGHVVWVMGSEVPGSIPSPVSSACHVDDLADLGTSSGFGVEVFEPSNGETGLSFPIQVTGEVCHGREVKELTINGGPEEITGLPSCNFDDVVDTCEEAIAAGRAPCAQRIVAESEDVGDSNRICFDLTRGETDLSRDIAAGDRPLGTFDAGNNQVMARAADDLGNLAFDNEVIFATGETAQPPLSAVSLASALGADNDFQRYLAETELLEEIKRDLQPYLTAQLEAAMNLSVDALDIDDTFVVGLTKEAIRERFKASCKRRAEDGMNLRERFLERVRQKTEEERQSGQPIFTKKCRFTCACDPTLNVFVDAVSKAADPAECDVLFPGDTDTSVPETIASQRFRVVVPLPSLSFAVSGSGRCKDKKLGICISKARCSFSASLRIDDIRFKFDVVAGQLLPVDDPAHTTGTVFPMFISGKSTTNVSADTSIGCIGGSLCNAILTALTLGLVDFTPDIDISNELNFNQQIGAGEPDPISIGDAKVDEEEFGDKDVLLGGRLSTVDITADGLVVGVKGTFRNLSPEVNDVLTSGGVLTRPDAPTLTDADAAPSGDFMLGQPEAFAVVNTDAINAVMASIAATGRLESGCRASAKTVGELLPASCDAIVSPLGDAVRRAKNQGTCHGIRTTDCESLDGTVGPRLITAAIEQGACHGVRGDSCSMVGDLSGVLDSFIPATLCNGLGAVTVGDQTFSAPAVQGLCFGFKAAPLCETRAVLGDLEATAVKRGACFGSSGANCNSLADLPAGQLDVKAGTCHGAQGADCSALPAAQQPWCQASPNLDLLEQQACNDVPVTNVMESDRLLFCSEQDLPPRFLIVDDPATSDSVETTLRWNDHSLGLILDRNGDGLLDDELASTPGCSAAGAGDCVLSGLCLDLNIDSSLQFITCDEGTADEKPGLLKQVTGVRTTMRQVGVVCGGGAAGDEAEFVDGAAAENEAIMEVEAINQDLTPRVCNRGLNLGGFVKFQNPEVIAIKTTAAGGICEDDPDVPCVSESDCATGRCLEIFDFLGISGDVQEDPGTP